MGFWDFLQDDLDDNAGKGKDWNWPTIQPTNPDNLMSPKSSPDAWEEWETGGLITRALREGFEDRGWDW